MEMVKTKKQFNLSKVITHQVLQYIILMIPNLYKICMHVGKQFFFFKKLFLAIVRLLLCLSFYSI